jgi:predicted naringenin-chalcone synthase
MLKMLSDFQIVRPAHELDQEEILEWIAAAHAESSGELSVGTSVLKQLKKIGLGHGKIAKRGVSLSDCLHQNWDSMEIYGAVKNSAGAGLGLRTAAFDRMATDILAQFYPATASLPDHMIHVTCTGYTAPSPAQKLVSLKSSGQKTVVTHAYHMGCYAAIPAVRIAQGLEGATDIVHTEICSLHMNPSLHSLEQLVVQSLFGDGFIKYSVSTNNQVGLQILATQEEILPDSLNVMEWICDDWGMKMTLSKEIPLLIVRALPSFTDALIRKARISSDDSLYFAIHPGGPKIIEQVAALLKLEPWQFAHSAAVLKKYGNMSSATLPHIWASMLEDSSIEQDAKIVSLAFGPGLTLAGMVLQCKR